jgi:long-chain acyl-CoA synthetase
MHPSIHAKSQPERAAIIMAGSGEVITFAELDARSNQVAQLLRARGIKIGDTVALCMENHPWFFCLTWGFQRAGVHYVGISSRLTPPEIAYILEDSGAKLLFGSASPRPDSGRGGQARPSCPATAARYAGGNVGRRRAGGDACHPHRR